MQSLMDFGAASYVLMEAIMENIINFVNDAHSFSSYRPVPHTSCQCKRLEKVINHTSVSLQQICHLESCHAGFRAGRSTNDQVVVQEYYIKNAFVHQQF